MALPPIIELLLRQGERNVGRINARYGAIGKALQPYEASVRRMYEGFQANEQGVGNAVSGSQTALGSQLGGQISSALQGIQAPGAAVSQYGGGTATTGAQAGQAIGGLSAAELGRLRGEGSAEAIYAAALPRLAALAGDAERRSYLAELANEMSDLALQESSRMAEQRLEQQRYDQEWRYKVKQDKIEQQRYQRETRYKIKQERLDRQQQKKAFRLAQQAAAKEYGLDVYEAQSRAEDRRVRQQQGQARINLAIRKQNESEAQFHEREARYQRQFQARMRAARQKGAQPNASLSAKYGYIVDARGRPILTPGKNGKPGKKIYIRTDAKAARGQGTPQGINP